MAHITKRTAAAGPRYDVRWRASGEERKKSFKLRRDADAFRRRVESEELVGVVVDLRSGAETLESFADRWLPTRLVRGRPLSLMTVRGYQGLLRRQILPALGRTQLRRLTPEIVRAWHADVVGRAGQDQAAKAYRLLRAILNSAVDDDLLGRNPCRIKGGGAEHASERPLVDLGLVFDLADAIEPRYGALVILGGLGGLRTGEMLGLRRVDIDPLRAEVRIRQQAQEVPGRGRVLSAPKSDAGLRTVALPRAAVEALEGHLTAFAAPGPDGAVFTGPGGGPLRRATLSAAWQAARSSAGAPEGLRIHDLRHHAATLMARMPGVTTKELMARIGHASPRAALIYQHATAERDRAIAGFLDQAVDAIERTKRAPVIDMRHCWRHGGGQRTGQVRSTPALTCAFLGGGGRNRTAVGGFAGPCLNHSATPPGGRTVVRRPETSSTVAGARRVPEQRVAAEVPSPLAARPPPERRHDHDADWLGTRTARAPPPDESRHDLHRRLPGHGGAGHRDGLWLRPLPAGPDPPRGVAQRASGRRGFGPPHRRGARAALQPGDGRVRLT